MGYMKNWLMEHDEAIGDAIKNGATSVQDVIAYCKTNMQMIDPKYIVEQWNEFMADPRDAVEAGLLTADQIEDLDNTAITEEGNTADL